MTRVASVLGLLALLKAATASANDDLLPQGTTAPWTRDGGCESFRYVPITPSADPNADVILPVQLFRNNLAAWFYVVERPRTGLVAVVEGPILGQRKKECAIRYTFVGTKTAQNGVWATVAGGDNYTSFSSGAYFDCTVTRYLWSSIAPPISTRIRLNRLR